MYLSSSPQILPPGVQLHSLLPHKDDRGVFLEAFRREWSAGCDPVQWNVVRSEANVLRGVHVHATHTDYLLVVSGRMLLGLHDSRPNAPEDRLSTMLVLDAANPTAVTVPPGVCHGFYFPEPSIHMYAVSHYWDESDELGCRFDEAELRLAWPNRMPKLSRRDQLASSYDEMRDQLVKRHTQNAK
ncbi:MULTISPECIES: dTDP-4-dehydrorhamnose 3,5-epimerase family protein [unclassified Ensifer]|uniref:dTDP-4-dehydrorhamnose 3,5-epimerase family protein n=1 Tax=unclassified Ensifer TaxID=2633371 RepID=UPI0013747B64|nr:MULTISPECIES: dTDP-4-dehydrorhamnose 3,5-epimerase family protein [unclassified Ensifer]